MSTQGLTPPRAAALLQALDGRIVLGLLPGLDYALLRDVRQELSRQVHCGPSVAQASTWQEVWNIATGATENRPGILSFGARVTCPTCRGRRFNPRTAQPCHVCMFKGSKFAQIRQTARYARPPADKSPKGSS